MNTVFTQIRSALSKRAAYRRTYAELSRLPLDAQLDLELYQGDAQRRARAAVYGGTA